MISEVNRESEAGREHKGADIGTITREELKAKMDRGDEFILVEKGPESSYRRAHLPGAILLHSARKAPELLPYNRSVEIIVYCLNFN